MEGTFLKCWDISEKSPNGIMCYMNKQVLRILDGTIPGNSQRGVVGHQFPRRRQRRSWRPGITPDTGVGVVLEAWCYTRAAGTEVIHVAATGFQGIPDCVARYKFPQNVATTGSIPTAARGVDIQRALSSIPG